MAVFYGMIQGNRGAATRGGSANSGYQASAQSYDGSVITYLNYNQDNKLMITIATAQSSSCYGDTKFYGTLDELNEALEMYKKVKNKEAKAKYIGGK